MPISLRLSKEDKEKLDEIRDLILKDITVHHTINKLSLQFGLNEFNLKNGFKRQFAYTIFGLLEETRLKLAVKLLESTNIPINQISQRCGYGFATNFTAAFKRKFGITPDEHRDKGLAIEVIQKAGEIIDLSLDKHHTCNSLAKKLGVSPLQLMPAFRKEYGLPVYLYLRLKRMERAKVLMAQGEPVENIVQEIGYKNVSCLYVAFKLVYNMKVSEWKASVSNTESEPQLRKPGETKAKVDTDPFHHYLYDSIVP